MLIRIKNLHLRTVIGLEDWERGRTQSVVVNLELELTDEKSSLTDDVADTADYKKIKNEILSRGEKTQFKLIEKLAGFILDIAMENEKVDRATVEIDKPNALRFADSVSVSLTRRRN